MRHALGLVLPLAGVLAAEAAFFAATGVPDAPGVLWAPRIAMAGTAVLIVVGWLSGRLPVAAETPRWPTGDALPLTDADWDPTTARLVSLFAHRRSPSLFGPGQLADLLGDLVAARPGLDASALPADLRRFLADPHRLPSPGTVQRWLDAIEGAE